MGWVVAYIATIVAVNWMFTTIPLIELPWGLGMWPPTSIVVGIVFVIRDLAQRSVGHWVLPAMLVGGVLSYWMASPAVALASVVAFAISEGLDWLVYTVTKRPFRDRVIVSSLVSTPTDSTVFLAMIGQLSAAGVLTMTLSKMLAVACVYIPALERGAPRSARGG